MTFALMVASIPGKMNLVKVEYNQKVFSELTKIM